MTVPGSTVNDRSSTASVEPKRFVSPSTSITAGRRRRPALARTVELAEEDPLPRPESERAVAPERDDHARAHQRCTDVRGRVLLALLDVLPRPAVVDDPLEGHFEVARDHRVGVLVDVTPAVVCGTYTRTADPARPPIASRTSRVMSTSWLRRSVRTRISCTRASESGRPPAGGAPCSSGFARRRPGAGTPRP